jgi:N-methylhydantoinase A
LTPDLSQGDFSEVLERRFEAQYERTYGKGAGFSGVNCEITALRGRAHKSLGQPEVVAGGKLSTIEGRERKIFWPEIGSAISTPVYRQIAERISGPVLVELPTTTVVVHKGQSIEPDDSGNLVMRVGG